jgi:hypothetical protein
MATVDAAVSRTNKRLAAAEACRPRERDLLVYDADWDEDARLAQWERPVEQTQSLRPNPCGISPDRPSGGAALLRQRDKTRAHLVCMNSGLRQIPLERRRSRHPDSALIVQLESDPPRGSERTQRPRSVTRAATSARAQAPRAAYDRQAAGTDRSGVRAPAGLERHDRRGARRHSSSRQSAPP